MTAKISIISVDTWGVVEVYRILIRFSLDGIRVRIHPMKLQLLINGSIGG